MIGKRATPYPLGIKIAGTRLTPIAVVRLPKSSGGNWAHELSCTCGKSTIQSISAIQHGRVKSCGCAKVDVPQNNPFTFDQAKSAFFEKVDKKPNPKGCWVWTGCQNDDGYGSLSFMGKTMGAHRASWIIHNGTIPEGKSVLHDCDNPPCVNPKHLWLGTQADNVMDCAKKKRIRMGDRRGEKHPSTHLTNANVEQIRTLVASGVTHQEVGNRFRIGRGAVGDIVNRRNWKHDQRMETMSARNGSDND